MAEYVDNELTIEGERTDLDTFKAKAKGENGWLDIEVLIPFPEELKRNKELAERIYDEGIWDEIKHFDNAKEMIDLGKTEFIII